MTERYAPLWAHDVTYFRPLYQQAVVALEAFSTHVTADAAFDAWYVYEAATCHGGIGAVPKNGHGHPEMQRDPDGVPRCAKGLRMTSRFAFQHTNGYRAQRFGCPLLFPTPMGEACERLSSNHGQGCHKDPNWEAGGLMRVPLYAISLFTLQ